MKKKIIILLFFIFIIAALVFAVYDHLNYNYWGEINFEPAIAYNETGIDGGVAEEFLNYLNNRQYSRAYKLYSDPDQIQKSAMNVEWQMTVAQGHKVIITKPGIATLEDGRMLYTFPVTNRWGRFAVNVYTLDNKVLYYETAGLSSDESVYNMFINREFEAICKHELPHELELKWAQALAVTGDYISTKPPVVYIYLDAYRIDFPTNFENGEFVVTFFVNYLSYDRNYSLYNDSQTILEGVL